MEQDYLRPHYTLRARGIPAPRYPDGRPATGRLLGVPEPLDAAIWDACGSKDINGKLHPIFGAAVGVPRGGDAPPALTEGLFRATAGIHEIEGERLPDGTDVWCGVISIHKDLAAPSWRDYARASARAIAQAGVHGVWCDNWSPWDNFGYPPVRHAFGDWSVHRFREYVSRHAPEATVREAGEALTGDIRESLRARARMYGAADPADLTDPAWRDTRWKEDALWRLYRAGRQIQARSDLKALHRALHMGAREGGCPDFLVCGNDIPLYGLGWAREEWTDMVHTEVTPGWHMGTGTRGIMLPPDGKMAVVYRAALAHQSSRFCAAWYYVENQAGRLSNLPGLGRVLMAEAFANGALLLCDPHQPRVVGTLESHARWNDFLCTHEMRFVRRRPVADIGLVFSPDCQLWELAPGGFPDMDSQPHVFGHWGWGTALMDAHLSYRVPPDWRIEEKHLRGFRVLILPDVECLSDKALQAIERWVRNGGFLVTTGRCGSRHGVERAFEPRKGGLLGIPGGSEGSPSERTTGKGRWVSLGEGLGMKYYLESSRRQELLPSLIGHLPSRRLVSAEAPSTLEIALWKPDGVVALDVDCANTAVDLSTDTVRPCGPVRIQVDLPWSGPVHASTVSPNDVPPATVTQVGRTCTIEVASVVHYVSVRLSPAEAGKPRSAR